MTFSDTYISKITQLKNEDRKELVEMLNSLRGRKCLIVEPALSGILRQLCRDTFSNLYKENDVSFHRTLGSVDAGGAQYSEYGDRELPEHIVYLIRPSVQEARIASREISTAVSARGIRSQIHVFFVPNRSVVCEQMFEDEGTSSYITFGELNIGIVPLDTDLLTTGMPGVFSQCFLDGDISSLGSVAKTLMKLQKTFGIIPHVKSKGAVSKKVLQLLLHFRREEELLGPG